MSFAPFAHAQSGPVSFSLSGGLYTPSGAPVLNSNVSFKIEILDATGACVLYSEVHSSQNLSTSKGRFAVDVGSALATSQINNLENSAVLTSSIFKNPGLNTPVASGACGGDVDLNDGDNRVIRISYDLTGGTTWVAMNPDVPMGNSAYASVAESVQGKSAADLVQIRDDASYVLNQSNVENIFSNTNYARLTALLSGSSSLYLPTNPTGTVSFNGQRLANIGTPSLLSDAATKGYADSYIGGKAADSFSNVGPAAGDGYVMTWDQGANKWVARVFTLPNSGVVASSYGSANTVPTFTVAADGRITAAANVTISGVSPGGAAGGDLAGTYPNPTIGNDKLKAAHIKAGYMVNRLVATDPVTPNNLTYFECATNGDALMWTAGGWTCTDAATLLGNSGVTASTYGNGTNVATFTVNAQGRITAASNTPIVYPVTSVNGKSGVITLNALDLGLGTAALKDYGAAPGNLVELDGAGKIPAAYLPTGTGDITDVVAGFGLLGGASSGSAGLSVNVGTGANQIVALDGTSKLPAVDGSALTAVNATKLQTRAVASTGPNDLEVLMWNNGASQWEPRAVPSAPVQSVAGRTGAVTLNYDDLQNASGVYLTYKPNDVACGNGEVLSWDGAKWVCAVDGGGDITDVVAGAGLLGGGTAGSAALSVNMGTGANQIVALDGTSKLPAVDGSALTSINATKLQTYAVHTATPADGEVLKWNNSASRWEASADNNAGGDITDVVAGSGLLGGGTTGSAALSVNTGTGANQIVQLDGTSKLPAVDGSNLTSINAVKLQTYAVASTAPTAGKVLGWNGTTNVWEPVSVAGTAAAMVNTPAGNISATDLQAAINELDAEKVARAGDTMSGALTMNAQSETRYADADSSNWIALRSPAAIMANLTLTLPQADGSSGQVLQTNGAGQLTWVSLGGGGDFFANGTVPMTGALRGAAGTSAAPGYAFSGDLDTGAFSPGADTYGISTQGSQRLHITAAGLVGIGTTSPASALDVSGTITTGSVNSSGSVFGYKFILNNSGTAPSVGMYSPSTNAIGFATASSERFRIDSAGNVGIGTTDPSAALQIANGNGIALMLGADSAGSTITNNTTKVARAGIPHYSNSEEPAALFHANSNATDNYLTIGGGSGAMNAMTYVSIYTAPNTTSTSGAERVRVTGAGLVGIGTTVPSRLLHVAGAARLDPVTTPSNPMAGDVYLDSAAGNALKYHNGSGWVTVGSGTGDFLANGTVPMTGVLQGFGGTTAAPGYSFNGDLDTGLARTAADTLALSTAGSARLYVTSTGAVGIGTSSPGTNLEVIGTSRSTYFVVNNAGTVGAPPIRYGGNSTGVWFPSNNSMGLVTNGTEAIRLESNGSVGIGTTLPSRLLHVAGTVRLDPVATPSNPMAGDVYLDSAASNALKYHNGSTWVTLGSGTGDFLANGSVPMTGAFLAFSGTSSAPGYAFDGDADTGVYRPGADTLAVSTAGSARMYVGANGYIGIGTTSPTQPLDVNGIIRGNAGIYGQSFFANDGHGLRWGGNNGVLGSSTSNYVAVNTLGSERVRVDSAGNVGIGTAIPSSRLHIVTDSPATASDDDLRLDTYNTGLGSSPSFTARRARNTVASPQAVQSGDALGTFSAQGYTGSGFVGGADIRALAESDWSVSNTASLRFRTHDGSAFNERMVITPAGNVGIGTAVASRLLHVAGAARLDPVTTPSNPMAGDLFIDSAASNSLKYHNGSTWVTLGSGTGDFLASGAVPMTGPLLGFSGTSAAPGYAFSGDADSGLYRVASDTLALSTAGSSRIYIDSLGQVGIGTTSPSYRLDVGSAAKIRGNLYVGALGTPGQIFFSRSSDGLENMNISFLSGNESRYNNAAGSGFHSWFTNNGSNTTERMRLNDVGNMGIGTAVPSRLLHVAGAARLDPVTTPSNPMAGDVFVDSAAGNTLKYHNGSGWVTVGSGTGDFLASGTVPMTGALQGYSGSTSAPGYSFSGDADTGIYRPTADAVSIVTAGTERVRVDASGFVGIGTVAPIYPLDVSMSNTSSRFIYSANTNSVRDVLILQSMNSGGVGGANLGARIRFTAENGASSAQEQGSIGTLWTDPTSTAESSDMTFDTRLTGTTSERMRLTSAGRLGIGTTVPSRLLHVAGAVRMDPVTTPSNPMAGDVFLDSAAGNALKYHNGSGWVTLGSGSGDFLANGSVPMTGSLALAAGETISNSGDTITFQGAQNLTLNLNDGSGYPVVGTSATDIRFSANTQIHNGKNLKFNDVGSDRSTTMVQNDDADFRIVTTAGNLNLMPSGFVGIGTTTPSSKLHLVGTSPAFTVVDGNQGAGKVLTSDAYGNASWAAPAATGDFKADGTVPMTAGLRGYAGTSALPGYAFNGDLDTGAYSPGANTYGISTQGSQRMFFDAAGNVGIGTSAPSSRLDVMGAIKVGTTAIRDSAHTVLALDSVSGSSTGIEISGTRGSGGMTAGYVDFYNQSFNIASLNALTGSSTSTGTLAFFTKNGSGNSERMRIDESGQVGIGTTTPSSKLHVAGTLTVADGTQGAGKYLISDAYGNASWANAAGTGDFLASGTVPMTAGLRGYAGTSALPGYAFNGDLDTGAYSPGANTYGISTQGSQRVHISATGDFGIGTASPSAKLHVADGALLLNGTTGGTPASGAGTRLMWIPAKGAMRAGSVTGTQWDDANVGSGSTALGLNTVASGPGATALGYNQGASSTMTASGIGAFVGGASAGTATNEITASSSGAFAYGYVQGGAGNNRRLIASGTGAIAMGTATGGAGSGTLQSSGTGSIAMGFANGANLTATGDASVAMGENVNATAANAFAFGKSFTNANANSLQIGFSATPTMTVGASNVGIGTTTPSSMLHVAGTLTVADGTQGAGKYLISDAYGNASWATAAGTGDFLASGTVPMTAGLRGYAGTSALPGYAFTGDLDTGAFSPGANTYGISTQGSQRIHVDASGNVGVGTTVPSYALDVVGRIRNTNGHISASSNANNLPYSSYLSTAGADEKWWDWYQDATTYNLRAVNDAYSASNAALSFTRSGNTISKTVIPSGSVGVGVTSPSRLMQLSAVAGQGSIIQVGANGASPVTWSGYHIATRNGQNAPLGYSTTLGWALEAPGSNYATTEQQNDMQFSYWNGSAWSTSMVLDSVTGNVGIGTMVPSAKLDLAGRLRIADGTQAAGKYLISDAYGNASWATAAGTGDFLANGTVPMTGVLRTIAGTAAAPGSAFVTDTTTGTYLPGVGKLAFATSGTEQMRLVPAGLGLGINESTSSILQDPNSRFVHLHTAIAGGNTGIFMTDSTSGTTTGDGADMYYGSGVLSIQSNESGGQIRLDTAGTNRLTILNSGYIGIGTNVPSSRLTISDNVSNGHALRVIQTNATNSNGLVITTQTTNSADSVLSLFSNGGAMSILNARASGNIGIGTSTPSNLLHVAGSVRIADGTQGTGKILVSDAYGSASWMTPSYGVGDFLANGTVPMTAGLRGYAGTSALPGYAFNGDLDTGVYSPGANSLGLSTQGSQRVVIDSAGFVGIGSSVPSHRLHVEGDLKVVGNIYDNSNQLTFGSNGRHYANLGNETSPSYTFQADADTGLFRAGSNIMAFATQASERMRIDGTGNIGVGTLSPAAKFHVYEATPADASVRVENGNTANTAGVDFYTASTWRGFLGWRGGSSTTLGNGSTGLYMWNRDNSPLMLGTNNTERLRIDATGNVGIGTSNPASALHVQVNTTGYIGLTDSDAPNSNIRIGEGGSGAGTFFPLIMGRPVGASLFTGFYSSIDAAEDTGTTPTMVFTSRLDTVAAVTNRPVFQWRNNASNLMTVNAAGYVGIGTTVPSSKLDVSTTTSGDNGISLTTTTTGNAPFITWKTGDASNNKYGMRLTGGASSVFQIGAGDQSGWTPHMTILPASGNVGVGTTAPSATLEVNGSIQAKNLATGLTPTSTGFSTAPTSLSNVNDGNEGTATGEGIVPAGGTGLVVLDLGSVQRATVFSYTRLRNGAAGGTTSASIYYSDDNLNWTGCGSVSSLTGTTLTTMRQSCTVWGRYIAFVCSADGVSTGRCTFYEAYIRNYQ